MLCTTSTTRRVAGVFALGCTFTLLAAPAFGTSVTSAPANVSDSCIAALRRNMVAGGEDFDEIAALPADEMKVALDQFASENDVTTDNLCLLLESGILDEQIPAEGIAYPSIDHLQLAAVAAGADCPNVAPGQANGGMQVVGCLGEDGEPTEALVLFDESMHGTLVDAEKDSPTLIGPNWAVLTETEAEARTLQEAMGGELFK